MTTTASVGDILPDPIQYSNSNLNTKNSNSTVTTQEVLSNISDLVHDGYEPFYARQLKLLGTKRFMELANKARAINGSPQRVFSWMLKNNKIVK